MRFYPIVALLIVSIFIFDHAGPAMAGSPCSNPNTQTC